MEGTMNARLVASGILMLAFSIGLIVQEANDAYERRSDGLPGIGYIFGAIFAFFGLIVIAQGLGQT